MKRILIAGEINPDLILQGYDQFPQPGRETLLRHSNLTIGGSGAICAAGFVRLGHPVRYVGKCGVDVFGEFMIQRIAKLGVEIMHIHRDPALSTGVTVSISDERDRAFATVLGAIAELRGADVTDQALRGVTHLHVPSIYLQQGLQPDLAALFQRAKAAGLTTSIDPGFDPLEEWRGPWEQALPYTDVFLPNESELAAITGDADPEAGLRALGRRCPLVVVKLGRDGAAAIQNGVIQKSPPFLVEAKDTTGAGDSFDAGFLHQLIETGNVESALQFGCACGALSTRGIGGTELQPTPEEAQDLIETARVNVSP